MEKLKVEGLLLCSKCDNQLQVEKYKGGCGFFSVKPCTHCFPPSLIEFIQEVAQSPYPNIDTDPASLLEELQKRTQKILAAMEDKNEHT